MKKLLSSTLPLFVLLGLGPCASPQSAPQPSTIKAQTGIFEPNVSMGGANGDDSTPVSVQID